MIVSIDMTSVTDDNEVTRVCCCEVVFYA